MQKSESIAALAGALAKAQAVMQGAKKDSENPFFKSKYADLGSVWDACRDALTKNELAVIQTTEVEDENGSIPVETMLAHSSGEWISGVLKVRPVKDDPQGMGSALTYARRYALSAMVGVAPEDDDGNAASQPNGASRANTAKRTTPAAARKAGEANSEPTAEVVALRDAIKKVMAQLNEAGDTPEWTIDRVNKMARENWNKPAAELTAPELTDFAKMFSQRLEDIRKAKGKKDTVRDNLIASIKAGADDDERAAYLKEHHAGADLESLNNDELTAMEKAVGIPF